MRYLTQFVLLLVIYSSLIQQSNGQTQDLTIEYKTEVIEQLSGLITQNYVFPEAADSIDKLLHEQLEDGHFDQFKNDSTFARALTASVRSIQQDNHLQVWVNAPAEKQENFLNEKMAERIRRIDDTRNRNGGLKSTQILEGNVGYLELTSFARPHDGKPMVDAAMKMLSNADAIIIDLTQNGGGSPATVQYLCSYFFEEKTHLNSLHFREGNRVEEYWTQEVNGTKLPNVPLFVMTSSATFSGAEEFSYNFQTQERGTLVGQTTRGGANPGRTMNLGNNLIAFIPTGQAINPITKTNWEGTGVIPHVATTEDSTLNIAHRLAKEAAHSYRQKKELEFHKLKTDLENALHIFEVGESDMTLQNILKASLDAEYLYEWDMNMLGYEYLNNYKNPEIAASIFKAITILKPGSANAYDSYAEALMTLNKKEEAIENYEKSLEINPRNDNGITMLQKMGVTYKPIRDYFFYLDANESWGRELFHFPLHFAQSIEYTGIEDARFPEGWSDTESNNFWSYVFAWKIDEDQFLSKHTLEEDLQKYFDGLTRIEELGKEAGIEHSRVVLNKINGGENNASFEGYVRTFDSFTTLDQITLHVKIDQQLCLEENKNIILFQFSPKEFNHSVWQKLKEVSVPNTSCN